MVSAAILGLLIVVAMVLDFGLARLDRQVNKSAADDAVAAGIQGFNKGDGKVYSYKGVCEALEFLKANVRPLSALSYSACATPSNLGKVCKDSDPTTHASYTSPLTNGFVVTIKSPYTLPDPGFSEDGLASLSGDTGAPCNQLAVIIQQQRKPGLGSLAGSKQLVTVIRSVGRVAPKSGDQAPALLLLDRTHCRVLQVAAGGSGAESSIHVKGASAYQAVRADGTPGLVYTAGSIHADTNASECSGGNPNPPVFLGKATAGIAAYGPPAGGPAGVAGTISSVAGLAQAIGTIRDDPNNVFSTTAAFGSGGGSTREPVGRDIVTRSLVNERYLQGVTNAVSQAQSNLNLTPGAATSGSWTVINSCAPTASDLAGVTATSKVYLNCTGGGNPAFKGVNSSPTVINAGTVVFNSWVAPVDTLSLPNATGVYIQGSPGKDALSIGNGSSFIMHDGSNTDAATGKCSTGPSLGNKAILFVKNGPIKETGGLLRMCRTTAIMLGGSSTACLPAVGSATAPDLTTPCGGSYGTGQLTVTGGDEDWTAPNQYDDMTTLSDSAKSALWNDPFGMEDLAFWSESGGTDNNPKYQMAGGGGMTLRGVFMTPNAGPFTVNGGGAQTLTNAQYIAASFAVTGGATLNMTVDPNNTITLPDLSFALVR